MGRKELKTAILVLSLVLLLSLTFQRRVSPRRLSKVVDCVNVVGKACHNKPVDHDHVLENVDDPGDHEADSEDYDFYRQYGDVPSPGVGH